MESFFRPHYGPGVGSASNRNGYQKYLLGVKAAGAFGLKSYHLYVSIVHKFLEPQSPGALMTCPGL